METKYKNNFLPIILLSLLLVLFFTCKMDNGSGSGGGDDDDDIIINTGWTNDNGDNIFDFFTNDPECSDDNGTSFWKYGTYQEAGMTSVTVNVWKTSGYLYSGFGIIFCVQNEKNFLTAMINTQRDYTVGKVVDGNYSPLLDFGEGVDWGNCDDLKAGYGLSNTIKVEYKGANNFELYLNGAYVTTFTDNYDPHFAGGYYGFIATVSPHENFPDDPVEVFFEPVEPSDLGLSPQIKKEFCYEKEL